MTLYTQSEVNKLMKAFEDYYEQKHGVTPCDFEPPQLEALEVNLNGETERKRKLDSFRMFGPK